MGRLFGMDNQQTRGPALAIFPEASEISEQTKHTSNQLKKLQAAADTLVEKAAAETMEELVTRRALSTETGLPAASGSPPLAPW